MQSISSLTCHCQCWCLHAAVSQGGVGLAASWCLQHVLASFAQSHTLVAQSMLHACFAAPMCTWTRFLAGESPVGSPSLHQPGSCAGRSPALEGSSQTAAPAWTSRQGELCSPWPAPGAWLPPACVRRAPRPGCSLQAAAASPCQGLRDQGCLSCPFCVLHTRPWLSPAFSATGHTLQQHKDLLDATAARSGDAWRQVFILIQDYLAG